MKTQAGGTVRPDAKLPKQLPAAIQTALLKWVLNHGFITRAIPDFSTYEHLEQDFSVARNLTYTDEEAQISRRTDAYGSVRDFVGRLQVMIGSDRSDLVIVRKILRAAAGSENAPPLTRPRRAPSFPPSACTLSKCRWEDVSLNCTMTRKLLLESGQSWAGSARQFAELRSNFFWCDVPRAPRHQSAPGHSRG